MAGTTTYAEFIKFPNTQKRYLILFFAIDAFSAATRSFSVSNIGNPAQVSGTTLSWQGIVANMPRMAKKANDLVGEAMPQWSEVVLYRQDGQDISGDRTGITVDDLGRSWIVKNRSIFIWYGGDDLPFSEYKLVFQGTVTGTKYSDTTVSLSISGKENVIKDVSLGTNLITVGSYPNAGPNIDKSKPVCIGNIFNMKPICVDPDTAGGGANRQFMYHEDGTVTLTAVRADGLPLTIGVQIIDNLDGTFTFNGVTIGSTITCDVAGKFAGQKWASMCSNVMSTYSGVSSDAAAVTTADAALPYSVNYVVYQKTPVADVVNALCEGIPATREFSNSGLWTPKEFTDPAAASVDFAFTEKDILSASPGGEIAKKVYFSYALNCERNWHVQTEDRTPSVPIYADRVRLALEYETGDFTDATIQTKYTDAETETLNTNLDLKTDADLSAAKWVALFGTGRETPSIKIKLRDVLYQIGDVVELTYRREDLYGNITYRFDWNAAKFRIIGITYDFGSKTTTLNLWG